MKAVKLGRHSMKALSQDTRVDIMKLLDERNHTQTEIAEALGMSAPSVKEHVEGLVKAGLIEKLEEHTVGNLEKKEREIYHQMKAASRRSKDGHELSPKAKNLQHELNTLEEEKHDIED